MQNGCGSRKIYLQLLGVAQQLMVGCAAVLLVVGLSGEAGAQQDWQHWRGPGRNGIAPKQKATPTKWSETENVLWKTKVPGRGHSSPIIVDGKVFLTTAERTSKKMFALAFDLKSGKQLWKTELHENGFLRRIHPSNSHASSTIATDGKVLFAVFCHNNETWLSKLDFSGKISSQKKLGRFVPTRYQFGFGASPIVYSQMVIVTSESETESFIKAFDIESGKEKWSIDRPKFTSYSTPVIAKIAGKDHLLMSGGRNVCSYNPKDGTKNWETSAKWIVSCGTMVWNDKLVFASGGYPPNQTLAINAKTGKTVWTNKVKMYEQSMLYHDGALYGHSDNGVIYCWDANSGEELWTARAEKKVSASPVLVGDNIYFTAESGNTYVVKASKEDYELVQKNRLGTRGFATLAAVDGKIITRVGSGGRGNYQEWLYCLGEK